jgi:hypothetical protein
MRKFKLLTPSQAKIPNGLPHSGLKKENLPMMPGGI